MGSQSIIIEDKQSIINTLDKHIVEDSLTLLKKIRFEIGKGISFEKQFITLMLRDIVCSLPCNLEDEAIKELFDTIQSKTILSKQEYL